MKMLVSLISRCKILSVDMCTSVSTVCWSSFPSIHFGGSSSSTGEEEEADSNSNSTSSGEDGGDDFASLFASSHGKAKKAKSSQSPQSMVVIPSPSGKKKGKFVVPTSPWLCRV